MNQGFFVTFRTIFGVTEILCGFRFVLEEKIGKKMPESSRLDRVLRKAFSKRFYFTRCGRKHLWAVEQKSYIRFAFVENITGNSPKVPKESLGIFCLISICKFGSFKNPFATIASLSEIYFRFRRFMPLIQTIKVISMKYDSSTSR